MRNYLLAAVAAAALTSPALAREDSLYVGIDGGVMLVEDTSLDYNTDDFILTPSDLDVDDAIVIDHNLGYDIDLVAGYDFGPVRAEGELSYKRASIDEVQYALDFLPQPLPGTQPFDASGDLSIFSIMANVMLDFGDEDNWSGYVGAGIGWATAEYDLDLEDVDIDDTEDDSSIAWQIIAGIRKSISPNLDLGLKYRFFNASKLDFTDDSAGFDQELSGRVKTHSLMLSLIYNFYAPPPPPPPPPATQTCPDGSVILATEACPPPPPPPPPPPEPERG